MSDELIDILADKLRRDRRLVYFNTARTEMIIRCVYCGDSINDETHAHFYISTTTPYSFFCQRCNTKGLLTSSALNDIDIDDPDLSIGLDKSIKKFLRNTTISGHGHNGNILGRKNFILDNDPESKVYQYKKTYLERRFGVELSTTQIEELKVITNLNKFLVTNKINNVIDYYSEYQGRYEFSKHLSREAVGFLTLDNNYAVFRHIKPFPRDTNKRRYFNENFNKPYDIGNKTYSIKNDVNILAPTLNVKLAEGVMDISSVWLNMFDGHHQDDTLFMAVNGKSYLLPLLTLRKLGFTSINLDIYSDSEKEVPLEAYKRSLPDFLNKINIHYNRFSGEKDFGVPKSRIKEKIFRIK